MQPAGVYHISQHVEESQSHVLHVENEPLREKGTLAFHQFLHWWAFKQFSHWHAKMLPYHAILLFPGVC